MRIVNDVTLATFLSSVVGNSQLLYDEKGNITWDSTLKYTKDYFQIHPYLQQNETIYVFKDKHYRVICESRIKAEGIAKVLDGFGIVHTDTIDQAMDWVAVVIYEALYDNPDGQIWVREKNEFYSKFKPKKDDT